VLRPPQREQIIHKTLLRERKQASSQTKEDRRIVTPEPPRSKQQKRRGGKGDQDGKSGLEKTRKEGDHQTHLRKEAQNLGFFQARLKLSGAYQKSLSGLSESLEGAGGRDASREKGKFALKTI